MKHGAEGSYLQLQNQFCPVMAALVRTIQGKIGALFVYRRISASGHFGFEEKR